MSSNSRIADGSTVENVGNLSLGSGIMNDGRKKDRFAEVNGRYFIYFIRTILSGSILIKFSKNSRGAPPRSTLFFSTNHLNLAALFRVFFIYPSLLSCTKRFSFFLILS